MWRSMQGTVILWMPLLQRDMWCSVQSTPQVRSSCAAGRHGYRKMKIQDHGEEGSDERYHLYKRYLPGDRAEDHPG